MKSKVKKALSIGVSIFVGNNVMKNFRTVLPHSNHTKIDLRVNR